MTLILTEKLKNEYSKNSKGIVYLFLVEANNLAILNNYERLRLGDIGTKTPENFVMSRIEEIYKEKTGPFWRDDFKGFEIILKKAREAKDDIIKKKYSFEVVSFIEEAIKSHIPKQAERPATVEVEPKIHLEIAKEQNKEEIILQEGEKKQDHYDREERKKQREKLLNFDLSILDEESSEQISEDIEEEEISEEEEEVLEKLTNEPRENLGNLADSL